MVKKEMKDKKDKKGKANVKGGKGKHPEEIPEHSDGKEIQEWYQEESQEEKSPT